MSGKSCGINVEKPQYMLGSSFTKTRQSNNTTQQIISAINKNKQTMKQLEKKTEHLEQSLLMQRSLEAPDNKRNIKEIDEKFGKKLDLMNGDFKEQMKLLRNYIQALEQKMRILENKIIQKTPVIPKKNDTTTHKPSEKPKSSEKPKPSEKPKSSEKHKSSEKPNVTLEIIEK
jgi:hypothetical protein